MAFPTIGGFVPAYETIISDTEGAEPAAYRRFVDAPSGAILLRESLVHQASDEQAQAQAAPVTQTFEGELPPTDGGCGPRHGPYTVAEGSGVRAIDVFANADMPLQDIVLNLYRGTTLVASADTLFTPEQIRYAPQGGVPAGEYFVEVCEFDDNAPPVEPRTNGARPRSMTARPSRRSSRADASSRAARCTTGWTWTRGTTRAPTCARTGAGVRRPTRPTATRS